MSDQVTGPHELESIPPIAFAQRAMIRVFPSPRIRRIPLDGLEVAARVAPFDTVRASIAFAETLLRRVLVPEEATEVKRPTLYPGAREDEDEEAFTAPPDPRMSIRSIVAELLDRSVRQSPRQAWEANQKRLLLQLVPDEVRILSALADGRPRVMEHLGEGTMGGSPSRPLIRYASLIGTEAGVRCDGAVPDYIAHLIELDLIEVGDEDPSLREQYEILDTFAEIEEAEQQVKSDTKAVGKKLRLKTAVRERHTISLTARGRELWEAARPDTHRFVVAEQWDAPEVDMDTELPPEPDIPRTDADDNPSPQTPPKRRRP